MTTETTKFIVKNLFCKSLLLYTNVEKTCTVVKLMSQYVGNNCIFCSFSNSVSRAIRVKENMAGLLAHY